ncbi:hypothetical protein BJP49_28590, partial [Paenibacillus odorifer]|uniref:phage tail-collar fiber domain-containing protein n=2 Tax=Paenibacillus TaxID=44249 RepID=UPI00096F5AD4
MSSWGGMTLTNKGMILQGKAQAGAQLIYTRIAVGDGTLSGQSVPALNGLISQKKNLPITRLRTQPPNKVMIGTTLSNADVTTGFYFREVGLFATDPDAGEILYAYANSGSTADYIAPAGDGVIEKTFDTVVVIGTTSNVSAIIDDSLVFTRESEFNAKFDASGGHKHTGAAGDGPKLTAASLAAGAATDTVIGDRTADPATATAYGLKGPITQWFSWIAKYFKAITGKANPFDTPDITLAATKVHVDSTIVHVTAAERTAWNGKVDKVTGKQLSTEDYTTLEKTKLAGIATGANNYTHPTGDGNQHVPATGTSNNGKVLKAGTTAGSISWGNVNGSEVVEDATHRFATDTEKVTWNAKETTTGSQAKADAAVLPINNRLNTESLISINLVAGQQILNATKNARLQGLKVQGRSIIDLFGGTGSGESLTGWAQNGTAITLTLSSTQKRSGSTAFKFSPSAGAAYITKDFTSPLDASKYYVMAGWVFIESYVDGSLNLALRDVGTMTGRYNMSINASLIGQWQFVYLKIPTNNTLLGTGYRLTAGSTGSGTNVTYMDEIRLYAVSAADYAAIGTTITGEAIDRLLPYVPPGINGVDGLYVRRYGRNLLPDKPDTLHANARVNGPYDMTLVATAGFQNTYIYADAFEIRQYTLSVADAVTSNQQFVVDCLDANSAKISTSFVMTSGRTLTFTTHAGTKRLRLIPTSAAVGTYIFRNWQLELGSADTQFQPREDSLIAFGGVELHANPTDGSEPDILREVNGRYEVTRLWREMVLDGLLSWIWLANHTGFKRVRLAIGDTSINNYGIDGGFVIKYNGASLQRDNINNATSAADSFRLNNSYSGMVISIANADSGWGDSYTPSADEIKAYFNGWKMYDGSASDVNTTRNTPYTTGQKFWRNQDNTVWGYTTIPSASAPGWQPYQLLYRLASVTTETVQEDGSLSLFEGDNFIEVGSGYVSRERVTPSTDTGNWYINNDPSLYSPGGDSRLKNKAREILNVFKDSRVGAWIIEKAATAGYGNSRANQPPAIYDPSASYSVSYIKLDKSPVPGVTGFYAASEKAQLHDLTDGVNEALARVSVVEAKKAEKDVPAQITPTLLNGWETYSSSNAPYYYKDTLGFVHIRGMVKSGVNGSPILTLPPGYRPSATAGIESISVSNNGSGVLIGNVEVDYKGRVT